MNTATATRKSFTPAVTPNASAIINTQSDDTYFVLEQSQPDWSWEEEQDGLALTPHRIIAYGDYTSAVDRYDSKERKARHLCKEEEDKWEWVCRGEGRDYVNFTVAKGRNIITVTLCSKERAFALTR